MSGKHCYCGTQEVDEFAMLQCQQCKLFFHSECLKRSRPSPLEGDVLFDFACTGCTKDGFERCVRLKLQWCHVIMLALYNLQLQGGGKCGYFRWREHICNFIDSNWTTFFGYCRKKTTTWHGTVAGILSAGCPKTFTSGFHELKELGWWSLATGRPPTHQYFRDTTSNTGNRGNRKILQSDTDPSVSLITEAPALQSFVRPGVISLDLTSVTESARKNVKTVSQLLGTDDEDEDAMDINPGSISPVTTESPSADTLVVDAFNKEGVKECEIKQESKDCDDESSSCFDTDDATGVGAASLKGVKRQRKHSVNEDHHAPENDDAAKSIELVGIAVYEEKRLLRLLEKSQIGTQRDADARRLRRKLILRQQKRERNLPLFDLNAVLQGDSRQTKWTGQNTNPVEPSEFRILDRYRVGPRCRISTNCNSTTFATKLAGSCANEPDDIVSPYTTRILKPFIWRDYESQPPKWCILRDISARRSKRDESWISPRMASIDYRYVRPQYIPAINTLCREFFWPGIDLSESLHYPDFSCVAMYRKVIIGFAFMVPDVKYNEAYISFVFTHPEWRGAGIATFMLYHLIQTCMGKDVTLHVSATNPALLLYQKFGFKVEEFVVDFYDKYFPIESRECKHAMFLRLSR